MTVVEWCKKNEISKHKYNYWNHKINKKEKDVKKVTFVEVTPIQSEPHNQLSNLDKSEDFEILYKDIQVTVPSNFNQQYLAGLMKVLQEL
jgi:hypothetical protein